MVGKGTEGKYREEHWRGKCNGCGGDLFIGGLDTAVKLKVCVSLFI